MHAVLGQDKVDLKVIESLVGKILHVWPLVPDGRFHVDVLLKAQALARQKASAIRMSSELISQLGYWKIMLPVCSGRIPIPDPDRGLPAWAMDAFSDAAGGSLRTPGLGVGAVCEDMWVYVPWSRCINATGTDGAGRQLGRKMSFLELLGPLLLLASGVDKFKNRPVWVWVDNVGSVCIWHKGYSTACPYATAVVKAIAMVAVGIGCQLDIMKSLAVPTLAPRWLMLCQRRRLAVLLAELV